MQTMGRGWGKADVATKDTRDWVVLATLHFQPGGAQMRLPSFIYTLQILNEYSFVWCDYFIKKKRKYQSVNNTLNSYS